MSWDKLCGEHVLRAINVEVRHPFDPNAAGVALDLENICAFVFEDPDDGYRSSAADPLIAECSLYSFGTSPTYLHVPCLIRRWTESEWGTPCGIEVIDRRNGKTILRLGTDNSDDYYASFTCDWRPQDIAENARQAGTIP